MAGCCDCALVSLVRQEVETAVEDKFRELGKRLDKLESEQLVYAGLHDQVVRLVRKVYSRSDVDDHLDRLKESLLERIDHVQELCDADCISMRKLLQKLQNKRMQVVSAQPHPAQRMPHTCGHQIMQANTKDHTTLQLPSRNYLFMDPPLRLPARSEVRCIPEMDLNYKDVQLGQLGNAFWEALGEKKCEFQEKAPCDSNRLTKGTHKFKLELSNSRLALDEQNSVRSEELEMKQEALHVSSKILQVIAQATL